MLSLKYVSKHFLTPVSSPPLIRRLATSHQASPSMFFDAVQPGVPDPMYSLKKKADSDPSPSKVDLGVGIYRNDLGLYQELETVKQAKKVVADANLGHDYELTTGNREFLDVASRVMFGEGNVSPEKLASVQTISGTGAIHLAAVFISRTLPPLTKVYFGVPAWGNYKPLFELVNLPVTEYRHYDASTRTYDHSTTLNTIRNAPSGSVFILQGCCHNPTGADPTTEQWDEILDAVHAGGHLPLFDLAYQGLGQGLDEDAYPVRASAKRGLEILVCQSFSKNFALYGERCGALHIICSDGKAAANVHDQLRCLIRWEISSTPAFGARIVKAVLTDGKLTVDWEAELSTMRERLDGLRLELYRQLTEVLKTPGDWMHITREKGLFSFLKLTPAQCKSLVDNDHIYLPGNGRINVSGLNSDNVAAVASAIDKVVRAEGTEQVSARLA